MMAFVMFAMVSKTQNGNMECVNVLQAIMNLVEHAFLILQTLLQCHQIVTLQPFSTINKKDVYLVQMDVFHVKVAINVLNVDLNILIPFQQHAASKHVVMERDSL